MKNLNTTLMRERKNNKVTSNVFKMARKVQKKERRNRSRWIEEKNH